MKPTSRGPWPASLGIVMMDLDHFKESTTHTATRAGDARYASWVPCSDHSYAQRTRCRYGGEEFTHCILPGGPLEGARQRAETPLRGREQLHVKRSSKAFCRDAFPGSGGLSRSRHQRATPCCGSGYGAYQAKAAGATARYRTASAPPQGCRRGTAPVAAARRSRGGSIAEVVPTTLRPERRRTPAQQVLRGRTSTAC